MLSRATNSHCTAVRETVDFSDTKQECRSVFASLPTQTESFSLMKLIATPSVSLQDTLDLTPIDLPTSSQPTVRLEWGSLDPQETLWRSVLFPPQPTTLFDDQQPWKKPSALSLQAHSRPKSTNHPFGVDGASPFQPQPTSDKSTSTTFQPLLSPSTPPKNSNLNPEAPFFSPLPSPPGFSRPSDLTFTGTHQQQERKQRHDDHVVAQYAEWASQKPARVQLSTPSSILRTPASLGLSGQVVFHSKNQVEYSVPPLEAAGIKSPENRKPAHGVDPHSNGALTYSTLHRWITSNNKTQADQAKQLIQSASLEQLAVVFAKGALWGWELDKAFSLLVFGNFLSNPACCAKSLYFKGYPQKKRQTCLKKLLGLIPLEGTEWWVVKRRSG